MTGTAIVLFLIAIGIVWGGLITSIVFLIRNPEVADLPDVDEVAGRQRLRASTRSDTTEEGAHRE